MPTVVVGRAGGEWVYSNRLVMRELIVPACVLECIACLTHPTTIQYTIG